MYKMNCTPLVELVRFTEKAGVNPAWSRIRENAISYKFKNQSMISCNNPAIFLLSTHNLQSTHHWKLFAKSPPPTTKV